MHAEDMLEHRVEDQMISLIFRDGLLDFNLKPASFFVFLAVFPGCERSLHGFSVQWQHVFADVHLQPQCKLFSTLRSRGWWKSVQWHHLALDCCASNNRQHSGGGCGLCLCLLTQILSDKWGNLHSEMMWISLNFRFMTLNGIFHLVLLYILYIGNRHFLIFI